MPGAKCTACTVQITRARRVELRHGAPKRVRIAAEDNVRFARPLSGKRFLITSAQNATPVHAEFLSVLKVAAAHLEAEIVVVPLRYKNPTSQWTSEQDHNEWWDEALKPYLFNQRKKLNSNLVLAADVKIQPTASSPLDGFEALTGAESCILAHPKMELRTVAAPSGRYPKILTTTGSVTRPNFTDSKAGKLGAFHHFLGAILVELDGKYWHLRQINADKSDGSFTDLETHYTSAGARPAPRAAALELGDTHARFACPEVDEATFGPGGIAETLNPHTILWNDVLDGYAVNPHHEGNPFIAAAKTRRWSGAELRDVAAEVEHAVRFVADRTPRGRQSVIIPSNHDNFLSRWINATDWRRNPDNAAFYLETAAAMLASVRVTQSGTTYADPFRYWVDKLKKAAPIRCLSPNESFTVLGIECGLHGDKGPNGARGTLRNLARVGARVISGHSHTPGIREGHYQCGTSTRRSLEYTSGPSSWLNTHCVVYATGKRALITVVDRRWRLPSPKPKSKP